mgnify:CR=1 FL=1
MCVQLFTMFGKAYAMMNPTANIMSHNPTKRHQHGFASRRMCIEYFLHKHEDGKRLQQ